MSQELAPNTPWLIVGLGNPGPRYQGTRHNVGFAAADELAVRNGLRFSGKQANAEIAKGSIEGHSVVLARPLTYMNNSGQSVSALARFYKIPHNHVLVMYDDIALPIGIIRIREKGSAGGHNGLTSVLQQLSTQYVPRLRIGVGRPADPRHSQIDWVLGRFNRDEQKKMADVISRAAEAVEAVLKIGMERAMNTFNTVDRANNEGSNKQEGKQEERV